MDTHNSSSQPLSDGLSLEDVIYETLVSGNKPLQLDSLARILKLQKKGKKQLEKALHVLLSEGRIVQSRGAYTPVVALKQAEGVLSVQRSGVGFVLQSTLQGKDIYIHPSNMGSALHGDTVRVLVLPGKKGPNKEGRVVAVVHRSSAAVPVTALKRQKNNMWYCAPTNPRIHGMFSVDVSFLEEKVTRDDLLFIMPEEQLHPGLWQATATMNLSHDTSAAAQEKLGKSNNGVPSFFPPEVLMETENLPITPEPHEWQDRKDLRDISFVTIDGKTAKDFDDAICVFEEKTSHGVEYRLLVAIADVAHYVLPGTALDKEALLRGNSYYFPLSVEPMLPEALSNRLCSLCPNEPRLCMVADMRYSLEGSFLSASFYSAVIESKARLTYGQIQRAILQSDQKERDAIKNVVSMLDKANTLAHAIEKKRKERGSLDFNMPEAQFSFDEHGNVIGIVPRERHFGHKLIEEFMIATNEAVSRFLESQNAPFLFRTHPSPSMEKIVPMLRFLSQIDPSPAVKDLMPNGVRTKILKVPPVVKLQQIISESKNTPQSYVINRMLLRSMMQAKYATVNDGHYGLGSQSYCHFTSPIRRYADLLVHRALKYVLKEASSKPLSQARLDTVADQINATERVSVEAEREVQKRLTILFLQNKIGNTYEGVISGVTDFGIFIEIPILMAEGMVRLAEIHDDYYEYNPDRQELRGRHTGQVFSLGQNMQVMLEQADIGRLEITLKFVEGARLQKQKTAKKLIKKQSKK